MTNAQIVTLYDDEGLSLDDLITVSGLDIDTIKLVLVSSSEKFNRDLRKDKNGVLFGNEQFKIASQTIGSLMYSEHDSIRFRAAKFVINENKGRHDVKNLKSINVNVNVINELVLKAKKAVSAGKSKVIDVPSSVKYLSE